jgi:probable phosphoglycerate mutase
LALPSSPIIFDHDFEEWSCDDGTLTPEEFAARWREIPEAQTPYYRFMAGFETWFEFSGRVHAAPNRITQEYEGRTVVVVTHGGVIGASFNYLFGLSRAIPLRVSIAATNGSITLWLKPDLAQRWALERFNDVQHLQ